MEKTNAKKEYLLLILGAVITAVLCGGVGALFAHTLKFANGVFGQYNWLVYILPLGGLLTVLLFKVLKVEKKIYIRFFRPLKMAAKAHFYCRLRFLSAQPLHSFWVARPVRRVQPCK